MGGTEAVEDRGGTERTSAEITDAVGSSDNCRIAEKDGDGKIILGSKGLACLGGAGQGASRQYSTAKDNYITNQLRLRKKNNSYEKGALCAR
jgi:hypothetical protein